MKKQLNKQYKDRVFRIVFRDKESLLELYNAVNGTQYDDPDALEIHTLEDVIYMGFKNDISFLIGDVLNLYEHQSTWSPNLPLRGLFYFAELYRNHVKQEGRNLYSNSRIDLPLPRFLVFYNGVSEREERQELRLSDSFPGKDGQMPALECIATVLNINWGKNRELLEKCKKLQDYSRFIAVIREQLAEGLDIEDAMHYAVKYCIDHEILSDILIQYGGDIMNSILREFDEEEYRKMMEEEYRREGFSKGQEAGRKAGLEAGRKAGLEAGRKAGLEAGQKAGLARVNQLNRLLAEQSRTDDIIQAAVDEAYQQKLFEEYGI